MEKLLLVMNSHKADTKAISFGCYMARLTGSKLTGLLIEEVSLETASPAYKQSYYKKTKLREDHSILMDTDQVMRYFSAECRLQGVTSDVYSEKGTPLEKVLYESRFADMIILTPDLFLTSQNETIPTTFVKQVLSKAECPTIIAPGYFKEIEEVIFCFDGSDSSLFAIKEFTHLFPHFKSRKVTALEIRNAMIDETSESVTKMRAWLDAHYTQAHFRFLDGEVEDELFAYLLLKEHAFVVMGAYGRGMLSTLFRKSTADTVIRTIDLPIFITHR